MILGDKNTLFPKKEPKKNTLFPKKTPKLQRYIIKKPRSAFALLSFSLELAKAY